MLELEEGKTIWQHYHNIIEEGGGATIWRCIQKMR